MPCVSVIVAVYNTQQYLVKCIDSILQQSFSDLELILVDDGSLDGSGSICDAYQQKDGRVQVIHKKNGGLSSARNAGMDRAAGQYVMFVDSDDYIDSDLIASVYPYTQEHACDVAVYGYFTDIEQNGKLTKSQEVRNESTTVLTDPREIAIEVVKWKRNFLFDPSCNKLYRLSLIREQGIRMPAGELFEDTAFNLSLFPFVKTLAVINRCFYHYMQHSTQRITNTYHPEKWDTLKRRHLALLEYLRSFPDFPQEWIEKANFILIKYAFSCFIDSFLPESGYDTAQRKAYIAQLYRDPTFSQALQCVHGSSATDQFIIHVAKKGGFRGISLFSHALYLAKYKYKRIFFFFKKK